MYSIIYAKLKCHPQWVSRSSLAWTIYNDLTLPPSLESPKWAFISNIEAFLTPLQYRNCKEPIRLKRSKFLSLYNTLYPKTASFSSRKIKKQLIRISFIAISKTAFELIKLNPWLTIFYKMFYFLHIRTNLRGYYNFKNWQCI